MSRSTGNRAVNPLARMPAVDRAILRIGVWEVLFNDEVPEGVAISEAVEAAQALLSPDAPVSQAELSALLSVAIKLYTSLSSDPYGDDALTGLTVTPTEACTVAAALLHSQSLSPFEFSVWFSTSGR